MAYKRSQILLCGGTGCTSSGSMLLEKEFHKELAKHDLMDEVEIVVTGCFGLCELGPVVIVYPEGTFYSRVEPSDIEELVEEHLVKGRPLERLIYTEKKEGEHPLSINELGFYKKQKRIALANCGVIDPEDIEEYIAFDGYLALEKVLLKMTPQEVIDEIKKSGLRGRGGGGFPTGLKWQFAHNAVSPDGVKYVACNADEGDPGAFMDRSVLEGDPHRIIEAMTIAAFAIGAQKGYVYIRAEYPIAVKRLQIAINQAKEYGLLGDNIFDVDFNFDLEIRLGAGAFVCGEETALMNSVEGKRGEP
ncbi:MAG: NAD(P)H-dependent oxidoreductase subunit E, partial [Eubacterium sp.]